jgi:putative Holliday junction resolvase
MLGTVSLINLTLLAFDYGTKKIGVAVGQMITQTATPLERLANSPAIWNAISNLISKWHPNAFVVGIPLNMDGSTQPITAKAKAFAKELATKFSLQVYQIDERLTTIEAKQMLYDLGGYKALQNTSVDSFAAKLILESWMRQQQRDE